MTYCVAMRLEEGLVFVSDSRTNAGIDQIAVFRKLHLFGVEGERVIVLQSSGNLATSQSVITLLLTYSRIIGPLSIRYFSINDS